MTTTDAFIPLHKPQPLQQQQPIPLNRDNTGPQQKAIPLKQPLKNPQQVKFDAAAEDFEASYLSEMLKPMFEGLKTDPLFGGGKGEEMFRSMEIDEYGKLMARAGGIGLARQVREEMIRIQEQGRKQ